MLFVACLPVVCCLFVVCLCVDRVSPVRTSFCVVLSSERKTQKIIRYDTDDVPRCLSQTGLSLLSACVCFVVADGDVTSRAVSSDSCRCSVCFAADAWIIVAPGSIHSFEAYRQSNLASDPLHFQTAPEIDAVVAADSGGFRVGFGVGWRSSRDENSRWCTAAKESYNHRFSQFQTKTETHFHGITHHQHERGENAHITH